MTEDTITVSYVYTKKDTSITTNYIDEQGKSIADSITTTGKVKDKYTTSAKDIYGYELITTPSNASGIMTEEPITVNYVYRLKDTSVVVNYVDDEGNALTDSITIEGKVFSAYNTAKKDFYGYELITTPSNASGNMTEEPITVNYVYRLKDASVVVNYVDEEGKALTDSITVEGKVFDDYTTKEKDFYGYKLTAVPTNASGTMTEDVITINYVYRLKDASVVVNYVDEEGNALTDSITIEGKVFDEYTTEEKTFEGYVLTEIPNNASGNMTETSIIVNYIYSKVEEPVDIPYTGDNGTNIILFTSLFVVDIILVGVLTIIIKRKNKKEENK